MWFVGPRLFWPLIFANHTIGYFELALFIAFLVLITSWAGKMHRIPVKGIAVLLIFLANAMTCFTLDAWLFFLNYEYLSSAQLGGHVYHLTTSYDSGNDFGSFYSILECDKLGLFCDEIHRQALWGNPTLALTTNASTIGLSIIREDGAVLYEHLPTSDSTP